jgi:cysteine synthase B
MLTIPGIEPGLAPGRDADLASQVGNTPLLRLAHIAAKRGVPPQVELYAKAEWLNPSGSVKDRAALYMLLDGERRGLLPPDKVILDASSGNTGIAYAMIGASRGYRMEVCLPSSASAERKQLLKMYGATVVETPAALGTDGAILEAQRRYTQDPDRFTSTRTSATTPRTGRLTITVRGRKSGSKWVVE